MKVRKGEKELVSIYFYTNLPGILGMPSYLVRFPIVYCRRHDIMTQYLVVSASVFNGLER